MKKLVFVVTALIAAVLIPEPSVALPGQTIVQFRAWAMKHKLLAGLHQTKDELSGNPSFTVTTYDHGIGWYFYASTNGATIQREVLLVSEMGKAPGTNPVRHDGQGYGFQFFSSLFGRAVAADFRASRLIGVVKDATNGRVTRYFAGARYGYAVANGVTVETVGGVKADMALAARCAAAPLTCGE